MKWCCLVLIMTMSASFAGDEEAAIARGQAARADGVPQAGIHDLKRAADAASAPIAPKVIVELARCLIEADREGEAVEWTNRPGVRDDPGVTFWRAQALAQQGDHAAALKAYRRAAALDPGRQVEANLGMARMLEALGRYPEALKVYASMPSEGDGSMDRELARAAVLIRSRRFDDAQNLLERITPKERAERDQRQYLLGRLALEMGRQPEAAKIYEEFDPRDGKLAAGVAIGEAEALSRSDAEKAEARIETFVRENPGSPLIGELLAKLDEVRSRQRDPSNAALKQWENDDKHPALSETATYYLARGDERQGRVDRAIRNYAEFIRRYPAQPLRLTAVVRLGRLLLATGQTETAAALLATSAARAAGSAEEAELGFLRGATEYQSGDFPAATKTFVSAANLGPAIAENALANATLAAVDADNDSLAAEILNALRKESAGTARRIELAQAFDNARAQNPDAGEQLAWLASRGGAIGERARLALAEWHWQQGDRAGAKSEFLRVANSAAAGGSDQKDYFAVYLADDGSERCIEDVAQTARDFVARHPKSSREADVRMKWGEVLIRGGDYRGARVQFEEAGNRTTDPARRQSALFLAARATAGSMSPEQIDAAIYTLLEDVASQKTGDLAEQARWEQAMLQSARNRPEESVKLLDSLIASTKDPRMRFAARLKKGDALLELSAAQPERAADAIKEWRMVADSPDALPAERNEALTHAAAASERAGDMDAAVSAYYEVLTSPRDKQPEYFWYYKAGFAAAQLLTSRERLKEAAAIYEKMAAGPGPRAEEAKEKVKLLRLRNFIWED